MSSMKQGSRDKRGLNVERPNWKLVFEEASTSPRPMKKTRSPQRQTTHIPITTSQPTIPIPIPIPTPPPPPPFPSSRMFLFSLDGCQQPPLYLLATHCPPFYPQPPQGLNVNQMI
ncbi:hypothetical protein GIB67_041163 [Kingdonia uniflora]|uniref:Uncharacterized protein n=1 Tax=Kingdonia uniflora TaxID=39325 RepID=A0A7J7LKA4_9MAGN|nr:hypothetical protein GIB67_041163 [Kingdonia uniflora]